MSWHQEPEERQQIENYGNVLDVDWIESQKCESIN